MYPPNLAEFFPELTTAQTEELLNTLPINPVDFSRMSDLYEQMFAVRTKNWRSRKEASRQSTADDGGTDPVMANTCLRQGLLDLLVSVAGETEKIAGFLMRDRYVEEEVPVIFGKKLETTFPGVETMNVERSWATVDGYDALPVTYKTVADPTVTEEGEKAYAQLPVSAVPNPRNIWIRKVSNNSAFYFPDEQPEWVANSGDPYWKTPLNTSTLSYEEGDVLYVHDRQYAYVDITMPTLAEGETLEPVYPGTNLIIPSARPTDILTSGKYRYWFYVYTLVLPDLYYDKVIDLVNASPEFWKMLPTIEFRTWSETSAPMVVTTTIGDQVDVYTFDPNDANNPTINAALVSQELGIYHFSIDPCFSFEQHCGYTPTSIKARIKYKVSSSLLDVQFRRQIHRMVQAMSYRIGAEMPILNCNCYLESGFIAEQRRETGEVHRNLFTNVEKFKIGYSNRIGNEAYHDIMSSMVISRTVQPKI